MAEPIVKVHRNVLRTNCLRVTLRANKVAMPSSKASLLISPPFSPISILCNAMTYRDDSAEWTKL
jgi:hypothetical protein